MFIKSVPEALNFKTKILFIDCLTLSALTNVIIATRQLCLGSLSIKSGLIISYPIFTIMSFVKRLYSFNSFGLLCDILFTSVLLLFCVYPLNHESPPLV